MSRRLTAVAALLAALLLLGGIISAVRHAAAPEQRPDSADLGFGLFSWDDALLEAADDELAASIRRADVTELYHQFSAESLATDTAERLVEQLHSQGVEVYALAGDPSWAYDEHHGKLTAAIDLIAGYNAACLPSNRIAGIMVDVEPYLLPEWDEGDAHRAELMAEYLAGMEHAYDRATSNGLELLLCIPTFYDVTNPDILEQLITAACDKVAVMNYNRTDERGQIAAEVELARRADREVICIYELQPAGVHDLKPINTYADVGLPALWESAERLHAELDYDGLHFAYHYYQPLLDLLATAD